MKVNYESKVHWELETDYLRCTPLFHGSECYDSVLIKGANGNFFGKLLLLFSCNIGNTEYPIAFIKPLEPRVGQMSRRDKDLGLFRLRSNPQLKSEFIPVHSIIRGVMVSNDFDEHGDHFVNDLVDPDIFLRVQSMMT